MLATVSDLNTATTARVVLIVDNDPSVLSYLSRILLGEGYTVDTAVDAPTALARVVERAPDLALLDIETPGLNGLELCRRFKNEPATRLVPIVLMSASGDQNQRLAGVEAGASDLLSKPLDAPYLVTLVRSLLRVKEYTDGLDSASSIMMTLAIMIEAQNGASEGHGHRMANYATAVGRRLGLPSDQIQSLHRGGFLHDIGMLAIPAAILAKPGSLTPEEYAVVKSHPVIGESLVANLQSLRPIRKIVRHHHERLDGSGYPDGLKGDAIDVLAQIIGIVDVFESTTCPRPYQREKTADEAIAVLRGQVRQGWLRADFVESFVSVLGETCGGGPRTPASAGGPQVQAEAADRLSDSAV